MAAEREATEERGHAAPGGGIEGGLLQGIQGVAGQLQQVIDQLQEIVAQLTGEAGQAGSGGSKRGHERGNGSHHGKQ